MNFNAVALVITILLGSLSQLILKSAFTTNELATAGTQFECSIWLTCLLDPIATSLLGDVRVGTLLLGLICYVAATAFWILALRQFDLGKAYAFLGFTYILVYAGSVVWPGLAESVTWPKSIGVALIMFGIYLISCKSTPRFGLPGAGPSSDKVL